MPFPCHSSLRLPFGPFFLPSKNPIAPLAWLLLPAFLLLPQGLRAQQQVSQYVLYGGFPAQPGQTAPAAPGYGVQFGTGSSTTNGKVGSHTLVKLTGNGTVRGDLHSGGTLEFTNNSTVTGWLTAANAGGASGNVLAAGSGTILGGNVDVNGGILISSGSIAGRVMQPAGAAYSGPAPAGGSVAGTPVLPVLPAMPAITPFPAAGSQNITGNQTISPGSFGNVVLTGNKTLTFSGPGVYVFNSITNSGTFNKFIYNFQGKANGTIRIYVHEDADLGKLSVDFPNGGDASRVFAEIHGKGTNSTNPTFAFNLTSGASGNKFSEWQGTVWAPYAAIRVGSGASSSKVSGALWSGTQINIGSNVTINYLPFIECPVPANAQAGPDKQLTCLSSTVQLSGSSTTASASYSWSASGGGLIQSGGTTATPVVNAAGTYTLTVTDPASGCTASDQAIVTANTTLPDAQAGPDKQLTCTISSVQLSGSSATASASYSWTASGGGSIQQGTTLANPTVGAAGTYTLTVTNPANGCQATDVAVVSSNLTPPNANAGPAKALSCAVPSALLSGSSTTAGAQFAWATTNGTIVTGANTATPEISAAGTYTLTVTNPVNGCTATATTTATLNNTPPDAQAGADQSLTCAVPTAQLTGSSATPNAQFSWTSDQGNGIVTVATTASFSVNTPGTYTLTVTNPANGCTASDEAVVTRIPCILPYYPPPAGGKIRNLLGAELTMLYNTFMAGGSLDSLDHIFHLTGDSVYIEVISIAGMEQRLLAQLQGNGFGLTDTISNGPGSVIITGKYPIINLMNLLTLQQQINYCRPLFPALSNSGVAYTQGDVALQTDFTRGGFNVDGSNIKVGVISDGYNTIPGNPALTDVLNGDLPGLGNPVDTARVQVLREYPWGRTSDEGRAMLQIVHDIAPKAKLAYRTGFISAGDFAQGIRALKQKNCDVIVDDVTFITEPFFQDGVVARAVDEVTSQGVSYFSAAGNFGSKSYQNFFSPTAAPAGLTGSAHNFGGGDIFQSISLTPGTYTIVLQWQDEFYSNGQIQTGTANDLDIYLTYDNGSTLFGFNRDNLGGDPLEVLPFTVTANTTTNIMIVREAGVQNVNFKYVVFRGEVVINEFQTGSSTIVGQANAEGAIAVGAVLYSNTPPFGVNPPTIASFSSRGGTPVNGVIRNKPDLTGPNGGNTTVNFGAPNFDGDAFPNFFGTSAAAPHAAGVAALMQHARQKFYSESFTPSQMRSLLQDHAYDMDVPGFDFVSGRGFIRADASILSFAAPTPQLISLEIPDTVTAGLDSFEVTLHGNYLTATSTVYLQGNPLPTTYVSPTVLTASVPAFFGNPPLVVCTPSISPSQADGGCSDTLYFGAAPKRSLTITADNKQKRYGEQLPAFTATVLLDGQPLSAAGLTLADVGLSAISFETPANSASNVGLYYIRPSVAPFDPADAFLTGLLERYTYTFTDGLLSIGKLPLRITPRDTTLTYGDALGNFHFTYAYEDSLITVTDNVALLSSIQTAHQIDMSRAVALVDGRTAIDGKVLVNSDLEELGFLATSRSITNGRTVIDGKAIVNGTMVYDTTRFVDVSVASIFNYQVDGAISTLVNGRTVIDGKALVNGRTVIDGKAIVNASAQLNSVLADDSTSKVVIIVDEADVDAPAGDSLRAYESVNLITGNTVGQHAIVPGALISENFEISYGLGTLTILPATLTVKAEDKTITVGSTPSYTALISGYRNSEPADSVVAGAPVFSLYDNTNTLVTASPIPAGTYSIRPSALPLVTPSNYVVVYEPGTLTVSPVPQTSDFVLFGGFAPIAGQTVPVSPGYGVQMATGSSVTSGSVGSHTLVKLTGNGTVSGNVHSNGRVEFSNNATVGGNITAANTAGLTGTIFQAGSGAVVGGNIDVMGDISISSGTISGSVTQPVGATYAGPAPAGGRVAGLPVLPALPPMPPIHPFPAAGSVNITANRSIAPGEYGNMVLSGNKTITFSGPGTYVFNTVTNSGTFNKFIYDFQGSTTGTIRIYVHGDADMGKLNVEFVNGGDASRIYAETHGRGTSSANTTFAFNLTSGASGGKFSEWQGTVWAPYAGIRVGSGASSSKVSGALWSGTQVSIGSNVAISYVPLAQCSYFGWCAGSARLAPAEEEPAASPMSAYPNPTRDKLTLSLASEEAAAEAEVTVYNLLGQHFRVPASRRPAALELDLSGLQNGLYILKVRTGYAEQQFRIIKQ